MKRILFCFALSAILLTSCKSLPSESTESIANHPDDEIKTIECSVAYIDSSTGFISYSTVTLEPDIPMEYGFIAEKVVELSGENIVINSITVSDGDAVIDLCSDYFLSENNNRYTEESLLLSLEHNLKNNFDDIINVFFSLDGEDFNSRFHSFSKNEVFSSELLEKSFHIEPVEIAYTIDYYDVVEDTVKQFSETKVFNGQIEPVYFVKKLSELMETNISVNKIEVSVDRITVDFTSSGCPHSGTGSYEESHILNSISQVLLQVYPEVNNIYIAADGKDYESGHIYMPKETPYATRQNSKLG